jgi:hypothetical protein
VLSHMRGILSKITPKSLMVCIIQRIREQQQLHTRPWWCTVQQKSVCEKIRKQEKIRENDKYQKYSFDQSHNPQNQTRKISIGKANKIKGRRSRISNPKLRSVFEIPENSLNCHPMWRSLKARRKEHGELNVRPCHCEVQEGANHAPVLPLVNSLTIFIWSKRRSGAHRNRHMLKVCHVELLR